MTATETIYNGQPALKADPYVENRDHGRRYPDRGAAAYSQRA